MTNNLNNFILMISLSRLKNNFNYIEMQNNIISVQLKHFFPQNENEIEKPETEISNVVKSNSDIFVVQNTDEFTPETSHIFDTNFFNSFVNISDSFKFDPEDWHFIYDINDDDRQIKK